ncbi:MAG: 50S ribosomal protein L4 [Methanosaeta sp. PtaB.Bin039]|nr:MAG: 50S ribosomal protein L4 [Methanosaeta sp. PtaB.Bin039]HOT07473.1 50S ribosomal protein L4 [Methanotrichaceae archaeon]HQF17002.1 50S ribosomal protein L4 [Methanotrichaceae archaeon]HQI91622.1 50S ribosomal protein L4 [Methanotrichaceae archaeon]HQJ28884.1 50S ribosomal protein L4 [Methanotrichaceae archaeon]
MNAKVIDLSGNPVGQIELPSVFEEEYRPDLIKRAVLAAQANRLQPYGPHFYAGMNGTYRSWGPGHGVSRVPRQINGRKAGMVPMARGGRASHPPDPRAVLAEKINDKERRKAIRSAIAATANRDLVTTRGHRFAGEVPVVVRADLESLQKTSQVKEFLEAAGLWSDVVRSKDGRKVRAGKGKLRGRRFKQPKSLLIVVAQDQGIGKAARNLPGVDFVTADRLNAELLAPGTHAGRLTIWTENSLKVLGDKR